MSKRFQKRVENFICAKCGAEVIGTGYTNHCPVCLWSQHVDVAPGDRAATCAGMMRPVTVRVIRDGYDVLHRCETCGHERWNIAAPNDSFDALLQIVKKATPPTTM